VKTYNRHRCERAHRSYRTMASCVWPWAHWVIGDGPYASVSRCRGTTIALWPTPDAAEEAKRTIDALACGGACSRRHDVIRLDLPTTTTARRAA
jgi:hypothetical protein